MFGRMLNETVSAPVISRKGNRRGVALLMSIAYIAIMSAMVISSFYNSQVCFSIGTSGTVQPAVSLAYAARNRGALVVEINPEPTPLTEKVDFPLHGKSGEILPALVQAVWG